MFPSSTSTTSKKSLTFLKMPNDYILRSDVEKMMQEMIELFNYWFKTTASQNWRNLYKAKVESLQELLSELSSIQSVDRWIPVSERLPENWEQVFCCFRWGWILDRQVLIYEDWVFYDWADEFGFPVTYWMPLPPNPSSNDKQ